MIIHVRDIPLTVQFPDWVQYGEQQEIVEFLQNSDTQILQLKAKIQRMEAELARGLKAPA